MATTPSSDPLATAILGIDFGGVIVPGAAADDSSFFTDAAPAVPPFDGCFEALDRLGSTRFANGVYVVSKASPSMESRTRAWMRRLDFHARTGIAAVDVRFVRQRADKAVVCRELGVTHFVDDRTDVLRLLESVPHRFLFDSGGRPPIEATGLVRVTSWGDLARQLLRTRP